MKIVHLCLSCFYIDRGSYQENELVKTHVQQKYDVVVVASTEMYNQSGQLCYVDPGTYMGSDGARVIRIPYRKILPLKVMKKLRFYSGLSKILMQEKPNAIIFHGLCAGELVNVEKYLKKHPECHFAIDSHEDFNNSARNFLSLNLLHKIYYKSILKLVPSLLNKVYCISLETIEFVHDVYNIAREKLIFYPLGGNVLGDNEYAASRFEFRKSFQITEEQTVFLQSGKLTPRKKIIESIKSFLKTTSPEFVFLIAGTPSELIKDEFLALIAKDNRIKYLGWLTSAEIQKALCAADVYLQPGTQSVTMQHSLCLRCAVAIDDVLSHQPYVKNNGWLLNKNFKLDEVFSEIQEGRGALSEKKQNSYKLAASLLDYKVLAKEII